MKKILKKHPKKLLAYLVTSTLAALLMVGTAFIYQALTKAAVGGEFTAFIKIALIAVPYLVIEATFDYWPRSTKATAIQAIMADMRDNLASHYLMTNFKQEDAEKATDVSDKLVNDLQVIENSYLGPCLSLMMSVMVFIFSLIAALSLQGTLTLIMLLLSFVPFLSPVISRKILADKKKVMQTEKKNYLRLFEEIAQNLPFIKVSNSQARFRNRLEDLNKNVEGSSVRFNQAQGKTYAVSYGLGNIVYSGTWIIGGFFVFKNFMTLPDLIAMTTLMGTIAGPIQMISEYYTEIVSAKKIVADHLAIFTKNSGSFEPKKSELPAKIRQIKLENLVLRREDQVVFDELSYRFEVGKKYVILGASGSGKSTLLNVLLGAVAPQAGGVFIDGNSLSTISLPSFYQHVSYVPQKSAVFAGSVSDNLSLFGENDPEKITAALKKVNLWSWTAQKSAGIATLIDEDTVSGGQAKRLDLARSLYERADVLLLDEPTSGLDHENEQGIGELIAGLNNQLVICTTHTTDPEFLAQFDERLYLKNGKLVPSE